MIIFDDTSMAQAALPKAWLALAGAEDEEAQAPAVFLRPLDWIDLDRIEQMSTEPVQKGGVRSAYFNHRTFWHQIVEATEPEAWRGVSTPDGKALPFSRERLLHLVLKNPVVARRLKNGISASALGWKARSEDELKNSDAGRATTPHAPGAAPTKTTALSNPASNA